MNDVYKDKDFFSVLLWLVPEYYDILSPKLKENQANKLEHYIAKIQQRTPLNLIIESSIGGIGTFMPSDNSVYISEETINDPFLLVFVLFHEGLHYKQFNFQEYRDSFSETEINFYKYNSAVSKIDGSLTGYIKSDVDLKNYFLQPLEYFAYKEAHVRGVELFSFMEKEFNEKEYVKKYNSISYVHPKNFKKSYYEKKIFPLHLAMIEKIKEDVIEDEKQYGLIKERVDKVIGNVDKLDLLTPVELSHFFFPLCWQELDLENKTKVYNEFVIRNKLRHTKATKEVLEMEGLEILDEILLNNANFMLRAQTNRDVDFITDFRDFNPYYKKKININKLYKKHKDKDIDSFYSFGQLEEAFFLFPKFKIVKDEYMIKNLKILSHLEETFTPDNRKHSDLDGRIFDLTMQLEAVKKYQKKQDKFLDKFQKNRVI